MDEFLGGSLIRFQSGGESYCCECDLPKKPDIADTAIAIQNSFSVSMWTQVDMATGDSQERRARAISFLNINRIYIIAIDPI